MKISRNYPNNIMNIKLHKQNNKKDKNLWDKEVDEINKILQNFEHVSNI